jgi:plasmid stabilization system protein ParE
MTRYRLGLSLGAVADLERLQDFVLDGDGPLARDFLEFAIDPLNVLTHQPGIGRPFPNGSRELTIEHGRSAYLALYQRDRTHHVVLVARIRHQREAGYTDEDI